MNAIEISCYYEALDDMFAFPSSPVEVPAFSDDQYEEYLGVYDQKEFTGKLSHGREVRHAQRPCPIARGNVKNMQAPECYGSYQPAPVAFVPGPSRIKSTTPNLSLLFSLFDVLEEEGFECNSNTSSPSCSGSEFSEVVSSPGYVPQEMSSPVVPPVSAPQAFMELPSHAQWVPQANSFAGFYPDRTSLLSNFADLN